MKMIKKISIGVFILTMSANVFAQNKLDIPSAKYNQIIDETIISQGNNYRLKKVLNKVRKGQEVHIAAIGGSVTEGAGPAKFTDGYAYQFFREFKAKYAPGNGDNLYFNNAALSGSSSLTAAVRYEKDVIDVIGRAPDMLIVEFAVNDGGEPLFQRSFEAIVRKALLDNPETAVIAVYAAATYGNTSGPKKQVADYYNLPQINMLEVVNAGIKDNTFTKEQFYSDYVHPTIQGHKLMVDSLMTLIANADKAKADSSMEIPAKSFIEPSLCGMKMVDWNNGDNPDYKVYAGGFNSIDKSTQTIKKTNSAEFAKNWHHPMNAKPDTTPFKMEINCKNLVMVWKNNAGGSYEKFGHAEVWIDGKRVAIYDGQKQGGWNNCEPNIIIDEETSKLHTVEVKLIEKDAKLGFTILAFGYSK